MKPADQVQLELQAIEDVVLVVQHLSPQRIGKLLLLQRDLLSDFGLALLAMVGYVMHDEEVEDIHPDK